MRAAINNVMKLTMTLLASSSGDSMWPPIEVVSVSLSSKNMWGLGATAADDEGANGLLLLCGTYWDWPDWSREDCGLPGGGGLGCRSGVSFGLLIQKEL